MLSVKVLTALFLAGLAAAAPVTDIDNKIKRGFNSQTIVVRTLKAAVGANTGVPEFVTLDFAQTCYKAATWNTVGSGPEDYVVHASSVYGMTDCVITPHEGTPSIMDCPSKNIHAECNKLDNQPPLPDNTCIPDGQQWLPSETSQVVTCNWSM